MGEPGERKRDGRAATSAGRVRGHRPEGIYKAMAERRTLADGGREERGAHDQRGVLEREKKGSRGQAEGGNRDVSPLDVTAGSHVERGRRMLERRAEEQKQGQHGLWPDGCSGMSHRSMCTVLECLSGPDALPRAKRALPDRCWSASISLSSYWLVHGMMPHVDLMPLHGAQDQPCQLRSSAKIPR